MWRSTAAGLAMAMALAAAFPAKAQVPDRLVLAVGQLSRDGFDPTLGWGTYGHSLFHQTLIRRNPDLSLVPELATAWSVNDDGLIWTVTLRTDMRFSDGSPVTAADVAYTYEAASRAGGRVDLTILDRAEVVDDMTVRLHLKRPQITIVNTMATLGIVPRAAHGPGYARRPIGSGPYRLVEWQEDQQLIVEVNPMWSGPQPQFRRLVLLQAGEDAALATARAGRLHLVAVPPALANQTLRHLRVEERRTVDNRGVMFPMVPPSGATSPTGAPVGNAVTADPAIRRALAIGLDRQELVRLALGGRGDPAFGVADGLPWDEPEQRLPDANLAGARAVLEAAGWRDSPSGVREKAGQAARFTLLYPASDMTRQALALGVADQAKRLGIRIDVSGRAWDEIRRLQHSNAVLFGWGAHTPQEMFNLHHSSLAGRGSLNAGWYNNPAVDAHLDAAQRATSVEASLIHWQAAQWNGSTGFGMAGDTAWAWLVNLRHVYFVHECLDLGAAQIHPHGHGMPILHNVTAWRWTCG